jgi:hypothetical protein
MKKYFIFLLGLVLNADSFAAGRIELFPERVPFFSTSAMEFRHYFYAGSENGSLVNHGNLGVEFPVVGFSPKENRYCLSGIAAAAHLVMFPENMKFAVDNFYAALAVYADCFKSEKISCRFYPVYHVSGHLGDGSHDDSVLVNARAVSSEMALAEVEYSPFIGAALSAGYGYYYHRCAQQGLSDRFDLAVRFKPAWKKRLNPFLTVAGHFIHLNTWRAGVNVEAGAGLVNSRGRGIGVSFRYFNRMHPGYYYDQREESAGVQVDLML